MFKHVSSIWLSIILVLGAVGCSTGLPSASGPTAPCTVVTSDQAAKRLIQKIDSQTNVKGKSVSITVTNEELSSLIAQFNQTAQDGNVINLIHIDKPVVCFKQGKMSLFGTIKTIGGASVDALLTIRAGISKGKAAFGVEQVQVGSIAAPQDLGQQVSDLINSVLNQNLDKLELVEIKIGEGQMTITGKVQ